MKTQAKSQASHQQVKVKLLLIEDNRLLREGLKALLDEQADMEVLAAVANWETALPKIRQLKPQVVLLDNLQGKATVRALEEISKEAPEVRIIVMDLVPERAELVEFIDAGASGFLIKDAQLHDFLATVRTVAEGGKVLPSDLTGSLFSEIVERVVTAGRHTCSGPCE